jgi:hypothetical protein
VTLRLDREHAAGSDDDMVDVAATHVDVVDRPPAIVDQGIQDLADGLLTDGSAVPTVDDRERDLVEKSHPGNRDQLDDHERERPPPEREARDHRDGHDRSQKQERS